jgi:predicted transcriptional regulator
MKNKKDLHILVDEELYDRVKRIASRDDRSLTQTVRRAIIEYLRKKGAIES